MKTDYQIVLSDTIQTIEHGTFDGCNIGEIHISKYVRYIEPGAFRDSEVGRFTIDAENPYYHSPANSNCIMAKHNAELIALGTNGNIPKTVKQIGTFSIWVSKLSESNILKIPEGVEILCPLCISASCGSKLELHLPSTIKRIFYQEWTDECDSIAKIVVPKGQRKRFSRMKNLQELKHVIIEET